jgi:hypothetical protein
VGDREHPIPGRDQRGDPRPAVGLDPHQHLLGAGVLTGEPRDQLVEPDDPGHTLGQPGLAQPAPGVVLHLHIVMILSPVITNEQHPDHPRGWFHAAARRRARSTDTRGDDAQS